MASEHDNRCDQKEWFMAGYNEMLRRIEPEKIICYNTPFPEMQGNIVYVDYERSSWRYMSYERNYKAEDLDAFKIGETYRPERDTITWIDTQSNIQFTVQAQMSTDDLVHMAESVSLVETTK